MNRNDNHLTLHRHEQMIDSFKTRYVYEDQNGCRRHSLTGRNVIRLQN